MENTDKIIALEKNPAYIALAVLADRLFYKDTTWESSLCKEIVLPDATVVDREAMYQEAWVRFQQQFNKLAKSEIFAMVHEVITLLHEEPPSLPPIKPGSTLKDLQTFRDYALRRAMFDHKKRVLLAVFDNVEISKYLLPDNIRFMRDLLGQPKAMHHYLHECSPNGEPLVPMEHYPLNV